MKIITNLLLIPSVILWMVCGVLFPLLHSVSVYITDVSYYEIIILNTMMYSSLVATPMGIINYINNVNFKTLFKNFKRSGEEKKQGCSSCKKK